MKICLISESPSKPSGFGSQAKKFVETMTSLGHEVLGICPSISLAPVKVKGYTERRFQNVFDQELIDTYIRRQQPDVVLIFSSTAFDMQFLTLRTAPANCPTFFWLPFEGETLLPDWRANFSALPDNVVIHLSNHARDLWKASFNSEHVIPHMIDYSFWSVLKDIDPKAKASLRYDWAHRLRFPIYGETKVIFCPDRNIRHKRWDCMLDYFRRFCEEVDENSVLIAHTRKSQEKGSENYGIDFNIEALAKLYGIEDKVVFTDFDWTNPMPEEDLRQLVALSDLRVSCSTGEGFGCWGPQCAAAGLPQVVNKCTCQEEIFGPGNPQLVEPSTRIERGGCLWSMPDVDEMVRRSKKILSDKGFREKAVQESHERAHDRFDVSVVGKQFENLFQEAISEMPRSQRQDKYRYGYVYRPQVDAVNTIKALQFFPTTKVEHLGFRTGELIQALVETGIHVRGREQHKHYAENAVPEILDYVEYKSYLDPFDENTFPIVSDVTDEIYWDEGEEGLITLAKNLTKCPYSFVRFVPNQQYGKNPYPENTVIDLFRENGLHHRPDVENLVKSSMPAFNYRIFCNDTRTSDIPRMLEG